MQKNTQLVVFALALVGVYLFGILTGAVGLPLARAIGGHAFGIAASGPFGPGAMMDRDFADGEYMMRDWDRDSFRAPARPDPGTYPGCPGWDDGTQVPEQDSSATPEPRPYGRGMMPPGTWR